MKHCVAVLLVGAALLATASAGGGGGSDPTVSLPGVTDLTPDNFAKEHSGRRAALIEFYAPWCGHCKSLVPEYTKLGQAIAANPKLKSRVLIAKVDADAHRELGEKFGVRGFPTLKWFPRGKAAAPEDYNGGRTVAEFLKFIEAQVAADAGFARVDALVPVAQKFLAEGADKAAVVKEAEEAAAAASAEDSDNAALYVRYMKKAVEKGDAYITAELERLNKMSEKPMSASKLDEISRKISVLSSFTEPAAAVAATVSDAESAVEGEQPAEPVAAAAAAAAVEKGSAGEAEDDGEEAYADGLDDEVAEEAEDEDTEGTEDTEEGEVGGAAAAAEDDPYDDSEL